MKYTKEILEKEAKNAISISDLIRKINKKEEFTGSTHKLVSQKIKEYNINISHFLSRSEITKNNNIKRKGFISLKKTDKEILIYNPLLKKREKRAFLKRAMLNSGKKYICEKCGISNFYNGSALKLDIDHIDGNWKNNNLFNLRFLCPNCHSQTNTYGNQKNKTNFYYYKFNTNYINVLFTKSLLYFNQKKIEKIKIKKIKKTYKCESCKKEVSRKSKGLCQDCHSISIRKVERPSIEELKKELLEIGSFLKVSKKYKVSDVTIKKWLKEDFDIRIEKWKDIINKIKQDSLTENILLASYRYSTFIDTLKKNIKNNNLNKEQLKILKDLELTFETKEIKKYKNVEEKFIEKKQDYINFVKKEKRIPRRHSTDAYERSLCYWISDNKKIFKEEIDLLNKEIEELLK